MSAHDDDSLDAVLRHTLQDIRGLSEESAVRRLHALSRLVRQKGDTPDRRALLRQAWQDLSRRCATTPSAAELEAWVSA